MNARQSRRGFIQSAGAAAAALAAANGFEAAAGDAHSARPSKKTRRFQLAMASYTLRKFPLDEALAMTVRAGLDRICFKSFHLPLGADSGQIAEAVEKTKQAGLALYGCGVVGMAKPEDVSQAFEYAKAAGMSVIVASPSIELLPLLDEKVKEYDIRIAIHNHGPGDNKFPTPQSVYEKVEKLDGRIGLCIDIGHTARIGADPIQSALDYSDRLHDVHIKDVSAAAASGKTVEIGRGVIDIPKFLETLVDIEYAGTCAFEYEKDQDDPLPGLSESVGYVKGARAAMRV